MSRKKEKRFVDQRQNMLVAYVVSLVILSLSIALMPIASSMKEKTTLPLFATGILFWTGLISTIGIAIHINQCRRSSNWFKKAYPDLRRLGLTHFFQNKTAKIMDITLVVSFVAFIAIELLLKNRVLEFVFISLMVFSFGMHCMLNGVNYIFVTYQTRREKRECEQK